MKTLLISGNTVEEWDVEQILTDKIKSKDRDICDMLQYEWDNTIGKYCGGMTYLEVEQFNNTYNNF
jgi:hypothetical protein